MSYHLVYHPLVVSDDIPKLDAFLRDRVKAAIEQKLETQPDVFGLPLRRSLKGHRKLRVGDYRVVYRIQQNRVLILAIQHRSIVYSRVFSRLS